MELALKIRNFSHFEADCGLRREELLVGRSSERGDRRWKFLNRQYLRLARSETRGLSPRRRSRTRIEYFPAARRRPETALPECSDLTACFRLLQGEFRDIRIEFDPVFKHRLRTSLSLQKTGGFWQLRIKPVKNRSQRDIPQGTLLPFPVSKMTGGGIVGPKMIGVTFGTTP